MSRHPAPDAPDAPDANAPAPDDEEALRWAGDEVSGREGARLPGDQTPDAMVASPEDGAPAAPGLRSRPGRTLLTFLFGVGYLAITVGWILGTGYASSGATQLLPEVLWQFAEFTAIIAAPLWFATSVLLTRAGRLLIRVGWLALGLGVLLPWPVLPLLVVS